MEAPKERRWKGGEYTEGRPGQSKEERRREERGGMIEWGGPKEKKKELCKLLRKYEGIKRGVGAKNEKRRRALGVGEDNKPHQEDEYGGGKKVVKCSCPASQEKGERVEKKSEGTQKAVRMKGEPVCDGEEALRKGMLE